MPRHLISDAHEWINEIPTVPHSQFSLSLSSFSLSQGRFWVSLSNCSGSRPPERLSELLSVSPWDMAPDPAPPPIILAIPAPSPPLNPASHSPNRDSPTIASVQPSSPPDQACLSPVLAPPPPVLSDSAPAYSATPASLEQCQAMSRRDLPADLLCFQSLFPPSSSLEAPSVLQVPAAPEPPPAAPSVSEVPSSTFPQLPSSSPRRHHPADASVSAQPAVLSQWPPPVRRNASTSTFAVPSTVVLQESAAPFPPLLQPSPGGHPSIAAIPAMPIGAPAAPLLASPAAGSLPAHPADLQQRPPSVRRNAQASSLAAAQDLPPPSGSNPSLPLRSFAQVASSSRGSGFVSSHARDIEAFARLPRTGINIISGSHEGLHSFRFVPSEFPKIAKVYANALVMKFLGGRPSLEQSHKEISSWGIENPFSIGPLSSRAFLLRFQNENDLLKVLTRPSLTLIKFPYKIFRWHTHCDIKEDSCMAPVWVSLPNIQLHCFLPEFLEAVANKIGRFLCLDKATATLARPSSARMCVEIDLRMPPPQFVWVELFDGFKQPVVYEKLPKFCTQCHLRGHSSVHCSKPTLDTPQSQLADQTSAVQNGTPPVRRNAKVQSSVISKENIPLGPLISIPQLAAVPPQPSSVAAPAAPLLASVSSHQDPPDPSQQQRHPPPFSPVVPASEQQPLQPPTSNAKALSPPAAADPLINQVQCLAAAAPLIDQVQCLAAAVLRSPSDMQSPSLQQSLVAAATYPPVTPSPPYVEEFSSSSQQHPALPAAAQPPLQSNSCSAAQPPLQSTISVALQQHLTQSPSITKTSPSEPHPPDAPPLPSEVEQAVSPSVSPPAAVRSSNLSAQAAPFPPSGPVQPLKESSPLNNQLSSAFLPVYINANGAKYVTSLPRQSLPIGYAPNPSFTHHQTHAFEGYDSENSFETDSQPNSPLESPKEKVNRCPLPSQSCASEGEQPTEEQPGFQGHISDVEFYHQPISSKKNKRQPDGPLRVKLRTRKGVSLHR